MPLPSVFYVVSVCLLSFHQRPGPLLGLVHECHGKSKWPACSSRPWPCKPDKSLRMSWEGHTGQLTRGLEKLLFTVNKAGEMGPINIFAWR